MTSRIPLKYRMLAGLSVVVLILDQLTKYVVIRRFQLGESISVISGIFNLTYVRNTGAAFGILHDAPAAFRIPFFVAVPIIALTAIGYVFKKIPVGDVKLSGALSLVIGGAVGNLIDRLAWGFVIDFLDFHWGYLYHFPAFNVADSAICIGVGTLMLDLFLRDSIEEEKGYNAPAAH